MSGWSGVVAGGLVLVLAFVVTAQPLWTWQHNTTTGADTWSYGIFGATNTTRAGTSNATSTYFDYRSMTGQPRMAAAFLEFQAWFLLAVVGAVAGIGLSIANVLRKLRGIFAAGALLGACAAILFGTLNLVLTIPPATVDLPAVGGQTVLQFEGQILSGGGGPNPTLAYGPGLGWYLALGVGLVLGFGASEMWSLPIPAKVSRAGRTPAEGTADLPPPPPVEIVPTPEEPVIEEVFVIASNGLLVKHMSRTLMSEKDRDVVGGMISVLSNFVRDAFTERDAGRVQEVTLGDHRFVIANDRGLVAAALVSRGDLEDIKHRLLHLLACLHDRYGERLADWQGQSLRGIEDEIGVLWEPFFMPPPPLD